MFEAQVGGGDVPTGEVSQSAQWAVSLFSLLCAYCMRRFERKLKWFILVVVALQRGLHLAEHQRERGDRQPVHLRAEHVHRRDHAAGDERRHEHGPELLRGRAGVLLDIRIRVRAWV